MKEKVEREKENKLKKKKKNLRNWDNLLDIVYIWLQSYGHMTGSGGLVVIC